MHDAAVMTKRKRVQHAACDAAQHSPSQGAGVWGLCNEPQQTAE